MKPIRIKAQNIFLEEREFEKELNKDIRNLLKNGKKKKKILD